PKLVTIKKKQERREKSREKRAEAVARLDHEIEKELLDRLRSKAYGDQPLNVNEDVWREILEGDKLEAESDVTTEDEDVSNAEEEQEQEQEWNIMNDGENEELTREFVSDVSEDESDGDMEDFDGFQMASDIGSEGDDESDESEESGEDEEGANNADEKASTGCNGRMRAWLCEHAATLYLLTSQYMPVEGLQGKRKAPPPQPKSRQKKQKRRGARVEIEYEDEAPLSAAANTSW
ncbi:Protein MAK16-like protein, partial [Spiromyces aspiralis]